MPTHPVFAEHLSGQFPRLPGVLPGRRQNHEIAIAWPRAAASKRLAGRSPLARMLARWRESVSASMMLPCRARTIYVPVGVRKTPQSDAVSMNVASVKSTVLPPLGVAPPKSIPPAKERRHQWPVRQRKPSGRPC